MAKLNSFKDILAYQKAYALSLAIHKASLGFPKIEQFALADQVRRSSKSICANIAEGFSRGRTSNIEFKRYLTIAISSCDETLVWLDYIADLSYVDSHLIDQWKKETTEIVRMLSAFQSRMKT